MPTKLAGYAACFAGFVAGAAQAQQEPLSVIDWLKRNPDQPAMTSTVLPDGFEPPVTPNATVPAVSVQPLAEQNRRIIGIVPSKVTGLPDSLWRGSDTADVARQLDALPNLRLPTAQALLYTLLLTEAIAPGNDRESESELTLARVRTLERLGAHDAATALLEQADVTRDKAVFAAYMDVALLTGEEDRACAIIAAQPHLAPSLAHRTFCTARSGDWPTAALLFDTGVKLGGFDNEEAAALERFLHAEVFEDAPPLPRPKVMTPLLFRLYEAIGEPFPTGTLPRAYATADLRDLAGWKQQLEAAERLALTGALSSNRLLGLYTARQPAASGGVWDRVTAIQQFETALRSRSSAAISEALPRVWTAMEAVGLEMLFVDLFAEPLRRYSLDGPAREIALTMGLLSDAYARVARAPDVPASVAAVAGAPVEPPASLDLRTSALLGGFDESNARFDLLAMSRSGRTGEALLRTISLLEDGAAGDPVALTQALATLQALGFEDAARRAALQIMLLGRFA